jgi:hypothetical protein
MLKSLRTERFKFAGGGTVARLGNETVWRTPARAA